MTGRERARRRLEPVGPRALGSLAILAGAALLLSYPLAVAGVVPGIGRLPPDLPRTSPPPLVYASAVGGALLLVWGAFAVRRRTLTPLSPRRALVALPACALSIALGVGLFVSEWAGTTPLDLEGNPATWDRSLLETVRIELTGVQFVALALAAALVVGAVAAERDRRAALASAALPVSLLVFAFAWGPQDPLASPLALLLIGALTAGVAAVGYVASDSGS